MQNYIGSIIKELRVKKGLTQRELAEGVCTVKQISRIEKNASSPSVYILSEVSNKLGNDLLDYIPYSYEEKGYEIKNDIDKVMDYHDSYKYDEALEYLTSSETLKNCESEYAKTMIDWILGSLSRYTNLDLKTDINYYIDILRRTKDFNKLEELFEYNLRPLDYKVLNSLIVEYLQNNEFDIAEKLLILAIENYERNYSKKLDTGYVKFLYNLSRLYFIQERFEEGLEISQKGINQAISNKYMTMLPDLYNICGKCLCDMGRREEGEEILRYYISLSKIIYPKDVKQIIINLKGNYDLE